METAMAIESHLSPCLTKGQARNLAAKATNLQKKEKRYAKQEQRQKEANEKAPADLSTLDSEEYQRIAKLEEEAWASKKLHQ